MSHDIADRYRIGRIPLSMEHLKGLQGSFAGRPWIAASLRIHRWAMRAVQSPRNPWAWLTPCTQHLSNAVEWLHIFLRSVGLGAISALFGSTAEHPKILVSTSWLLALIRCSIHVLPSAVSLVLVTIHIRGYFIGSVLEGFEGDDELKFGLLQVAAKIQVNSCGVPVPGSSY